MDYAAFAKFPFSLTATSISVLKGRRESTKRPIQTLPIRNVHPPDSPFLSHETNRTYT
jgi:hypothetical protein